MPPHVQQILTLLRKHLWAVLLIAFLLAFTIGYLAGYRLGPGLTLVKVGTLELTNMPDGALIFADQAKRGSAVGGTADIELVPGNHMVIVSAVGYEPWNELVTIAPNTTLTVKPIMISTSPQRVRLAGKDATSALALLKATGLPSDASPLPMAGGCALVSVSDNRIIASPATTTPTCASKEPSYLCPSGSCAPAVIFAPQGLLEAVVPFPGRDDALIVAFGDSVYVLELDPRNPQFFAPLLSHVVVQSVAPWSKDSVVVSANNIPFQIGL